MTLNAASVMSEAEFTRGVVNIARELDWLAYHTQRSMQSEPGFPDVVLIRPPRVIFAELKREKGGRLSRPRWNKAGSRLLPGQTTWKEALEACPGSEYYLWRPSDLDAITEILMRPSRGK